MDKLDVLKKSEPFKDLSDEELDTVAKLCRSDVFEPGTIIFKKGPGERLHVIEDGNVSIMLEVGPLTQRQVQTASKFDVFGWSSMIEPFKYTSTAKATKKTTTLSFNGRELYDLCTSRPDMGLKITRGLFQVIRKRLREAYHQLIGISDNP